MVLLAVAILAWAHAALGPAAAAAKPRSRAAASGCPGEGLRPTGANAAVVELATLCLVNRLREAHRLHALRANPYLLGVAASQVAAMVSFDYFADVRPSGQTPFALVSSTRYPAHAAGFAVGQNIAWGTGGYSDPAHIVAEWMASPPHRAIILAGEYRDAGVAIKAAVPGVLRAGRSGATYAMEFGRRF